MRVLVRAFAAALALIAAPAFAQEVVNDITQLNPIFVERVVTPVSVEDVSGLVASHDGPISIGGGRFSQGGQTACAGCLFLDMRKMNRILAIDEKAKTITVQAGATWRQIQEAIDPSDLSPKIMQSYSNFTVGGSISVNCHGDYVGLGPLVFSLRSIKLVLADGSVKTASRTENADLFSAAVGGYGGIGVIVEASLDLSDNIKLERTTKRMDVGAYPKWFNTNIAGSKTAVLHYALLYPPEYKQVNAITSSITDKPLTITDRLAPQDRPDDFELATLDFVTHSWLGKAFRENIYDNLTQKPEVVWRNYEAADDVYSVEPRSRAKSTYVLQEYFVPVEKYGAFIPVMAAILNAYDVNVLNVAIRHAYADRETLLAWAPRDTFAFVLYYEQKTDEAAKKEVALWTRKLIDAAIAQGGAYYLPYQIHASPAQFLKAYPRAPEYFEIKRRVDPTYKFRNKLWEAYFH